MVKVEGNTNLNQLLTTAHLHDMVMTAKHYCFTLNNYTDEEEQVLKELGEHDETRYLTYGREKGESGTPHLQGYIVFTRRIAFNTARNRVSTRCHMEKTKGSPASNKDYCQKDGDFVEYGTAPGGQGKRTDLDQVYDAVKTGSTRAEIGDAFKGTYLRYKRSIDQLLREVAQTIRDPANETNVIVYWGSTGAGKTRKVWEAHPHETIYCHTGERWFDGYQGQEIALFDDFDGSVFKLTYFLRLLDRYPMKVPIKGDYVEWNPKTIYITSNKAPEEWYSNASEEHKAALLRRLTTVECFFQ